MRPVTKFALCVGVGYCIERVGRAIWVAPGWCALVALLCTIGYAFDAPFIDVVRAVLGIIVIFWTVGTIGLWLNDNDYAALASITGMGIFAAIADMLVGNDAIEAREAARRAHELTLASQVAPAHGMRIVPILIGIAIPFLIWGIVMLCRAWNRHRQYGRQLEAFNFALRYEPDARFTCEPPKRPSKPRAKPQAPEAPYQPPAPVYQAPTHQVAVYQPPAAPVHQPGWLAQGRREAGLG